MALHIIDHPLLLHKLSLMREKDASSIKFRELLKEISMLMGYEITKDFPVKYEEIASLDEGLNDNNYILPGLGNAGDRIFGTK